MLRLTSRRSLSPTTLTRSMYGVTWFSAVKIVFICIKLQIALCSLENILFINACKPIIPRHALTDAREIKTLETELKQVESAFAAFESATADSVDYSLKHEAVCCFGVDGYAIDNYAKCLIFEFNKNSDVILMSVTLSFSKRFAHIDAKVPHSERTS